MKKFLALALLISAPSFAAEGMKVKSVNCIVGEKPTWTFEDSQYRLQYPNMNIHLYVQRIGTNGRASYEVRISSLALGGDWLLASCDNVKVDYY